MQEIWSRTLIFWASLAPVTDVEVVKTNTSFLAYGLSIPVNKISLLIIIVTGDSTQVPVLLLWWPVVIMVISRKGIGYIDPNGWDGAWKSWAARAIITITLFIIFIVSIVLSKPVRVLDILGALKKLGSRLLILGRFLIEDLFVDMLSALGEYWWLQE